MFGLSLLPRPCDLEKFESFGSILELLSVQLSVLYVQEGLTQLLFEISQDFLDIQYQKVSVNSYMLVKINFINISHFSCKSRFLINKLIKSYKIRLKSLKLTTLQLK